jgi:hypothetical protein
VAIIPQFYKKLTGKEFVIDDIGGGGTAKNALGLAEKGVNIVTLPRTI